MPAEEQLTQVERDKLEIDPNIDFRDIAARDFDDISPNEMAMFKWCGVYHQLQRGYFMIRLSMPAGQLSSNQLRAAAELAAAYGQNYLCITTRQTLQFHWIRKDDIYKIIEGMREVGIKTRNACGDVCRNVVSCSLQGVCPHEAGDTLAVVNSIAQDPVIQEQKRNLPRKHKISVSGCGAECGQALMNCQGWYPVQRKVDGALESGWAYTAGGGLGSLPHMGQLIFSWVPEDLVLAVSQAGVEAHNRCGNRRKRRLARLKIIVKDLGARGFAKLIKDILQEDGIQGRDRIVEADEAALKLDKFPFPGRAVIPQKQPGLNTVRVLISRSEITADNALFIADLAQSHAGGEVSFTNRQNLEIRNVPDALLEEVLTLLNKRGFKMEGFEHLPDMVACVGTTLCNLAVSDTPNAYYRLVEAFSKDEDYWRRVGPIRVNMNGCPNSCGQHWIADIGLRGKRERLEEGSEEGFSVFVGGRLDDAGHIGEFVWDVSAEDIVPAVKAIIDSYLQHRSSDEESFGDFARRLGGEGVAGLTRDVPASAGGEPVSEINKRLSSALLGAWKEAGESK